MGREISLDYFNAKTPIQRDPAFFAMTFYGPQQPRHNKRCSPRLEWLVRFYK